ncbi:hypothetical protein GKS17_00450 [Streptococcus uberis]|uniref:erythromycin esterase family protein n=1 Tax=Streptococcus uberis TaxID=1349 RepID=UPI0012B67B06|nr:erythromycin esterase family protein [Streptococcus uberis]MTC90485.1 hypothetical protein [Streptococcus uberis]MTC95272.1 hypothetical protein [Streptococcus uberis]
MKKILAKFFILFVVLVVGGLVALKTCSLLLESSANQKVNTELKKIDIQRIPIPEKVNIVGLGEATHGTRELQELRISLIKNLVKSKNYRAVGIEVGYGEVSRINQYICGEVDDFQFQNPINQTKEMRTIVNWLRNWNNTNRTNQVRIYGFDMQGSNISADSILNAEKIGKIELSNDEKANLEIIQKTKKVLDSNKAKIIFDDMHNIKKRVMKIDDSGDRFDLIMKINEVSQAMETWITNKEYNVARDRFMFENINKIITEENSRGNKKIILLAHQTHLAKYNKDYKVVGRLLAEKYKKEYFSIGSNFFKGRVNIKLLGKDMRINVKLISLDRVSAQAKYSKNQSFYLNLNQNNESEKTNRILKNSWLINVGEGYNILMKLQPESYKMKANVYKYFDGMVYYYETNPINPK